MVHIHKVCMNKINKKLKKIAWGLNIHYYVIYNLSIIKMDIHCLVPVPPYGWYDSEIIHSDLCKTSKCYCYCVSILFKILVGIFCVARSLTFPYNNLMHHPLSLPITRLLSMLIMQSDDKHRVHTRCMGGMPC